MRLEMDFWGFQKCLFFFLVVLKFDQKSSRNRFFFAVHWNVQPQKIIIIAPVAELKPQLVNLIKRIIILLL